jgi:hypothetical protein
MCDSFSRLMRKTQHTIFLMHPLVYFIDVLCFICSRQQFREETDEEGFIFSSMFSDYDHTEFSR